MPAGLEMDAFAGYSSEDAAQEESEQVPTFTPAWQNDEDSDEDSDADGNFTAAAAAKTQPEATGTGRLVHPVQCHVMTLPYWHIPHASGLIQWARDDVG